MRTRLPQAKSVCANFYFVTTSSLIRHGIIYLQRAGLPALGYVQR